MGGKQKIEVFEESGQPPLLSFRAGDEESQPAGIEEFYSFVEIPRRKLLGMTNTSFQLFYEGIKDRLSHEEGAAHNTFEIKEGERR